MSGRLFPEQVSPFLSTSERGSIEVICGSMFSGKTEELLRRVKRARIAKQVVQLFKPRLDDRYDEVKVMTHDGLGQDAIPIRTASDLLKFVQMQETTVVAIDEAQFFELDIVPVCELLADSDMRIICAGLDQDYLGQPFGPMPNLMAVAESVTKLRAICSVCGALACRSQRLVGQEGQLFVGGVAAYQARCRRCHVRKVIEPQDA